MCPSDSPGQHAAAQERMQPVFAQDIIERLFDFSPDAILVTDGRGIVRAANPRTEELFGYSSHELIGQSIEMLVPARFRGSHPRHRENYGAAPAHAADGRGAQSLRPAQRRHGISRRYHAQADRDRCRSGGDELYPRRDGAKGGAGGAAASTTSGCAPSSRASASTPSICSTATATC